jgi:hypothetical protein
MKNYGVRATELRALPNPKPRTPTRRMRPYPQHPEHCNIQSTGMDRQAVLMEAASKARVRRKQGLPESVAEYAQQKEAEEAFHPSHRRVR